MKARKHKTQKRKKQKRKGKQKGGFGFGGNTFGGLYFDGVSSGFKASAGLDMKQRGGFFGDLIKGTAYLAGRAAGAMIPKSEIRHAQQKQQTR